MVEEASVRCEGLDALEADEFAAPKGDIEDTELGEAGSVRALVGLENGEAKATDSASMMGLSTPRTAAASSTPASRMIGSTATTSPTLWVSAQQRLDSPPEHATWRTTSEPSRCHDRGSHEQTANTHALAMHGPPLVAQSPRAARR